MKITINSILAVAGMFALFANAAIAAPVASIHAVATLSDDVVILDVFADIDPAVELRSFGLKISFNDEALAVQSMGRYNSLWFLSPDAGNTHLPYSDPELISSGEIEIIGGRFDSSDPMGGITGTRILLATIRFGVLSNASPKFSFDLAKPAPFTNFASVEGDSLDDNIGGLGLDPIVIEKKASADKDDDGLPDDYEIATFGDIDISDGTTDFDGDGRSDADEWIAGTDPNDPKSVLALGLALQPDGSKLLKWDGLPSRVYALRGSNDLAEFSQLAGNLPGAPDSKHTDPATDQPRGFYKLHVENPTNGR